MAEKGGLVDGYGPSASAQVMAGKARSTAATLSSKAGSKLKARPSMLKLQRSRVGAKVIGDIKNVLFPHQKWVKRWDALNLFLLILLLFIIPYQVGVTAGIYLLTNLPWLVVNVLINTVFFIDTFLHFWRAYYNEKGFLIVNLSTIRINYLKTFFIPNLISVLPTTLTFFFVAKQILGVDAAGSIAVDKLNFNLSGQNPGVLSVIKTLDLLKFIRFYRLRTFLKTSALVTAVTNKYKSQHLQLLKFTFLVILISHWFACIMCAVAFFEVGGFGERMITTPNWIVIWFNGTAGMDYTVDVPPPDYYGLQPIGWFNDMDRYVLSLFWAIQTLTSIGYGNIAPYTPAEWWVMCILMLLSGILWAYVIGGLVGIVVAMSAEAEVHRARVDDVNVMKKNFTQSRFTFKNDQDPNAFFMYDPKDVEKRIKNYLHIQNIRSELDTKSATLDKIFPVWDTLPPELQIASGALLTQRYFDVIPYLSKMHLSSFQQGVLACTCKVMDFSAGETIDLNRFYEDAQSKSGRGGIIVLRFGMALIKEQYGVQSRILCSGQAYGIGNVLLDDKDMFNNILIRFLTFAQIIHIPRDSILDIFEENPTAWSECGRYVYARTLLKIKASFLLQRGDDVSLLEEGDVKLPTFEEALDSDNEDEDQQPAMRSIESQGQ